MSLRVVSLRSRYVCHLCQISRRIHKRQRRGYGTNSITSNPGPDDIYDIVTVGGGPVGLALLAAITQNDATKHLKCALIESQNLEKQKSWSMSKEEYSNRASSITPTNQSFLENIGAWQHLEPSRVQPYDEMQVWDASHDQALRFDWSAEAIKYNAPLRTVASMVENANLSRSLLKRIEELGADDCLLSETKVAGITNGLDIEGGLNLSTWPVLKLENSTGDRHIAARLLIGADGINSPVRAFAGINTNGWDYNRHGVVATLKVEYLESSPFASSAAQEEQDADSALEDFLSSDEQQSSTAYPSNRATAYQRFLPSLGGPIAILPLPNNHASLVWSTTPQIARTLKQLSPAEFTATVNAALRLDQVDIEYMLSLAPSPSPKNEHEDELAWRSQHTPSPPLSRSPPRITGVQTGTVASFPLRLRNATAYINPHIALAGDAAHTIHPLAGQGLNLGLGDSESLARTIAYATEHGMDIGSMGALEGYARERYVKAVRMSSGVDLLNGVYQIGAGDGLVGSVLSRMRGLGMGVVGAVPGLREGIMKMAE